MNGRLRFVTKIKKPLLLLVAAFGIISLAQAFMPALPDASDVAYAGKAPSAMSDAEKQRCYDDYNGNSTPVPNSFYVTCGSTAAQTRDGQQGYCAVNQATKKIVCPNLAQDRANQENIARLTTAPLITLVCGTAPPSNSPSGSAGAAYTACANAVRAEYNKPCVGTAIEEANSDNAANAAIADCITPGLNRISGGKTVSATQVQTAVANGRNAAEKAASEIGSAKSQEECALSGGTWTDNECVEGLGDDEVVCSGGALGWLICPLIDIMTSATQSVASLLDTMLVLEPLSESTGNGGASGPGPVYQLWQSILNIANIVLVIAFLFVIFSQATSVGLSSYGIKKMLPKIIAAAILMNLSFFICQVLVDISNILGGSAAQLVQTATDNVSFGDAVTEQVSGIEKLFAGGIAVIIILFFFLIPVLLSFLAVFFTVAVRFALIILLILVAPLAFAAWVLPNTEQYFKKWWSLFFNLLMLYPIIMFVFAAAIIASRAVAAAGQ